MSIRQTIRENLLAIADAYVGRTGLSRATVSRQFYGNQSFFDELRAGECSITDRKLETVLQEFSDRWPPGLKWPKTAPARFSRPRRSVEKNL